MEERKGLGLTITKKSRININQKHDGQYVELD